jgi:glycosyltransferase involved in cell wall biosynthesis
VQERIPDAHLVFIGCGENPEDEDLLYRTAVALGVANSVEITGWLPRQAAWARVRRAAVCVSPYHPIPILQSTSPTKLVEYMALGRPIVANEHPEQSDLLARSGAGIVCAWDERRFASAVTELLRDPARAYRMGQAGRRFIELNRTHAHMADRVCETYRQVLEGQRQRLQLTSQSSEHRTCV